MISPVLGLELSPGPDSTKNPDPNSTTLCLHCGKALSWIARFRGQSRFCSEKHRELYKLESDRLALEALHWNHGAQVKAQRHAALESKPEAAKSEPTKPEVSRPAATKSVVTRPEPSRPQVSVPDPPICGFIRLQSALPSECSESPKATVFGTAYDAFPPALSRNASAILPALPNSPTRVGELVAGPRPLSLISMASMPPADSCAWTIEALPFRIAPAIGAPAAKRLNPQLSGLVRFDLIPRSGCQRSALGSRRDPSSCVNLASSSDAVIPAFPSMSAHIGALSAGPLPLPSIFAASSPATASAWSAQAMIALPPMSKPAFGGCGGKWFLKEPENMPAAGPLAMAPVSAPRQANIPNACPPEALGSQPLRMPQSGKSESREEFLPISTPSLPVVHQVVRSAAVPRSLRRSQIELTESSLTSIQLVGVNDPDGRSDPRQSAPANVIPAVVGEPVEINPPKLVRSVLTVSQHNPPRTTRKLGIFIPRLRIGTYRPRMAFGPVPEPAVMPAPGPRLVNDPIRTHARSR